MKKKTHEEYENQLFQLEIDYFPVETYSTCRESINHECLAGHVWKARPDHILEGKGCPECNKLSKKAVDTKEEYIAELRAIGSDLEVIGNYVDRRTPITHKCKNGHEWKAAPTNKLNGSGCPQCNRKGIYSEKYFANHPEKAVEPGVLYVVVLVNTKTFEREAVKIGMTKGTNYRDAIKRSKGFDGYEIRIQKLVKGTLEEVFHLEQYLHEKWSDEKYKPKQKFGGWSECFNISALPQILKSIPNEV